MRLARIPCAIVERDPQRDCLPDIAIDAKPKGAVGFTVDIRLKAKRREANCIHHVEPDRGNVAIGVVEGDIPAILLPICGNGTREIDTRYTRAMGDVCSGPNGEWHT